MATLCAFLLLAGTAATPPVEAATELGNQISSGRRSQAYYESAMLAQDAAIRHIKAQSKVTKRALKQAKRAITRSKRALRIATATVQARSARLSELEALHAGTPVEAIPEGYQERLRTVRKEVDKARARRQLMGKHNRTALRQRSARQYRLKALQRQLRAAVARRESAEAGLGAYIVQLTRLAQERAEIQSSVQLSSSGAGFTWPSVGRISQTYGCTGFRLNPPRGSCRHFHDGLDIVSGYGSKVSSAADGVVAYAGWNPWDEGGRAWVMVVSHPDGYVTRYGHLLPASLARVGQFVRQGEAIGRMGNTGRSTGTHLHFELLRGGSTVNPWDYLPAGMVTVKVKENKQAAKAKAGKAKAGRARSARATRGRAATAAARRTARASQRDTRSNETTPGVSETAIRSVPAVVPPSGDRPVTMARFNESVSDPGSVVCRPANGGPVPTGDACVVLDASSVSDDSTSDTGSAARSVRRAPDVSTTSAALVRGVSLPPRGTSPLPE